jgi:hypothetical protein
MPRTCKDEAPILVDEPVVEGRYVEMDGYTVDSSPFAATRTLPHCFADCRTTAASAHTGVWCGPGRS